MGNYIGKSLQREITHYRAYPPYRWYPFLEHSNTRTHSHVMLGREHNKVVIGTLSIILRVFKAKVQCVQRSKLEDVVYYLDYDTIEWSYVPPITVIEHVQ